MDPFKKVLVYTMPKIFNTSSHFHSKNLSSMDIPWIMAYTFNLHRWMLNECLNIWIEFLALKNGYVSVSLHIEGNQGCWVIVMLNLMTGSHVLVLSYNICQRDVQWTDGYIEAVMSNNCPIMVFCFSWISNC